MFLFFLFAASLLASSTADRLVSQQLKSSPDGQLFYAQVQIGQGSRVQTFNLSIANQFHGTWIPSADLYVQGGYRKQPEAELEPASEALVIFGRQFKAVTHYDKLRIGSVVLDRQPFSVISGGHGSLEIPIFGFIHGMLGLAVACHDYPTGPSYSLESLRKSGHIDQLKYSLYINNTALEQSTDDGGVKGALVFGGVDERYYSGRINYAKMYLNDFHPLGIAARAPQDKTLIVASVTLDWSGTNVADKSSRSVSSSGPRNYLHQLTPLKLDTSNKLFSGPAKILERVMMEELGAKLLTNNDIYVFADCRLDNKPDLVFSLATIELKIRPEDYVIQHQFEGQSLCLSGFMSQPEDSWIFGTRFLRRYYTVFDFENELVGFATPV